MLDELATITGSFIYFKGDIPHLKYITDTNETIDETYLCQDDVIVGKKYFINSLVFSRAEESDNICKKDDTSITQNGLHEFRISDNQILSTLERDTFIDELFNYLKTLEFYIFDVKSTGIMWFEVADKFTISAHNNTYPVVLLNDEITVDQDIEEHLFSDEPEETQTKYKYADKTDRRINQAYILVDKQNLKITQLTEETTENTQKLTKVEQDVNGITSKVSSVEQSVENITNTQGEAEGKNIHIEDSSEEPFVDISLHGESTQKTRSGKNLAILGVTSGTIGEVPFIVDKGTININGTTISGDANYYFNSFRVSNSGVATFWIEITGYTDKLSNQAGILLQESSDNSTWSTTKEISCKSIATKQYQVTLDKSKYYRIRFYTKENTFTNATIKIQLEYGTNKTEFEEAGASPSPDYPSEIENNVEGNNKFDVKDTVKQYGEFELLNDNDKLVLVATGTLGAQYAKNIISGLNKNKTYRFSCKAKKISKVTEGSYININISGSNDGTTFTSITNLSSSGTSEGIEYSLQANLTNYEYYRFYFYNHPSTPVVIGEQTEYYDIQLKENTEPTDYVPYNSLEFKVEGKNRFDKSKDFSSSNISKNLWTITQLENGLRVMSNYSSGTPYIRYIITDLSNFIGKTIRAKANFVSSSANKGAYRLSICNADGTNPTVKKVTDESNKEISFIVETLEEGKNFLSFELYSNFTGGTQSPTAYVDYTDIIITIDDEDMTYEPYKSQVETFPLGNQKLMEGSYLASDGIHHTRKQVVFDGSEIWSKDENKDNSTDYFYIKNIGINTNNINSVICDYFKKGSSNVQGFWATTVFCITINKTATGIVSSDTKDQRVAKWKTWLSKNPITVEYDLAEEETVPYTAEQQEAWDKIEQLHTYKNVTNITSTAYAKVTYMRDNGLDVYETKQNAQKKYTETSTEIQQLDDSIKRTISQIGDRSQKTTTVTEDIDGIKNEVSKIQDLTQTTNGTKTIVLSNCVKGNLLKLQIKGNNTVFKYLYPSDYLYPTDDLFPMGDSRISVTDKDNNETVYKLGITDVLRQNGEVYDEFVLENGQAKVIRRINADGTIKASETIENLGTFNIPLNEGTNTIKIKNYSAEIGAKYVVKSDYTEAFATKLEMNSSIEQTAEKIESKVSKTYETLEDARTQYSNIKQTTNEISTQVVKKVGKNEIISSVNQSAEQIQIEADKININGTVSANGNFKVDTNGNMECNNGKFNGGTICLKGGTRYNTNFKIIAENGDDNTSISPTNIFVDSDDGGLFINGLNRSYQQKAHLYTDEGDEPNLYLYAENKGTTRIKPSGIKTPTLTQTSKAESKKNFENLSIEEAKKILNNTEIYKYNLKTQEDNDKKYIGFVIGDDYNYAEEITSENNDGANIYSMTSVLYTVVQEQQKQINQLQEKIEKLEGGQDK